MTMESQINSACFLYLRCFHPPLPKKKVLINQDLFLNYKLITAEIIKSICGLKKPHKKLNIFFDLTSFEYYYTNIQLLSFHNYNLDYRWDFWKHLMKKFICKDNGRLFINMSKDGFRILEYPWLVKDSSENMLFLIRYLVGKNNTNGKYDSEIIHSNVQRQEDELS